jgi:hypothetical protein
LIFIHIRHGEEHRPWVGQRDGEIAQGCRSTPLS